MAAQQAAYSGGEDWLNQCVDYIDGNHDFANHYIKTNIPMMKVGHKPRRHLSGVAGCQRRRREDRRPRSWRTRKTKSRNRSAADRQAHRGDARPTSSAIGSPRTPMWRSIPAPLTARAAPTYMRMNIATARPTLKAALDSMAGALKNLA